MWWIRLEESGSGDIMAPSPAAGFACIIYGARFIYTFDFFRAINHLPGNYLGSWAAVMNDTPLGNTWCAYWHSLLLLNVPNISPFIRTYNTQIIFARMTVLLNYSESLAIKLGQRNIDRPTFFGNEYCVLTVRTYCSASEWHTNPYGTRNKNII